MISGMNANTGRALGGMAHVRQSVRDILTTPIGTRVLNREYGSRLFELLDAPLNAATTVDIIAAAADALARWEPRLRVESVRVVSIAAGAIALAISAVYLPTGETILMDGVTIQ